MNNGTLTPKIQEILSNVWGPPLWQLTYSEKMMIILSKWLYKIE